MNTSPRNQFIQALHNPVLYELILKITQKPFYLKNPKQELIWRDLEAVLLKYKHHSKYIYISDQTIYDELHQFMNAHYYSIYSLPHHENNGRSLCRVLDIQSILEKYFPNIFIYRYVDIGCSEGGITSELGKHLGCGLENVYGLDIIPPERAIHQTAFRYIQIHETEKRLPFMDNHICLATALMSFHHILNVEVYIEEIYRILLPGGILIIQEHDARNENDKIGLDILHGMYSMVWCGKGKRENEHFCSNYFANYKSREEWEELICSKGFTCIGVSSHLPFKSIAKRNIHRNYWEVFQKK